MNQAPISNPFDEDEKTGRRPVVWAVFGLGILCISGFLMSMVYLYKPDPQTLINKYFATPTLTATPTPTQTATPTPDIFLTAVSQADPVFEDVFDSNRNNWNAHFSNNTVFITKGMLILRAKETGYIGISYCMSCPSTDGSFYFQAKVSTRNDTSDRFGMVFCSQDYGKNYYTFKINQRYSKFDFFKHTTKGWDILVRNKSSSSIEKFPNSNTLGVLFDHGNIKLYINNVLAYSYKDEKSLKCNHLGFFVDDGGFDMLADDVAVYKILPAILPTP